MVLAKAHLVATAGFELAILRFGVQNERKIEAVRKRLRASSSTYEACQTSYVLRIGRNNPALREVADASHELDGTGLASFFA
jgi:hypothetical protein